MLGFFGSTLFSNIIAAVSALGLLVGGGFALWKWRHSVQIRRAEFANQLLEKIRFTEDIQDAFYEIEYSKKWYDRCFHSSELERKMDKLLVYLNYICYLKKSRCITQKEFSCFEYILTRVCQDEGMQTYLWNLYHFAKKSNRMCSWGEIIEYGVTNDLFLDGFKANQTNLYEKTLNF